MDSIFALLEKIRQRPAMYISKKSIHCLKAFLDGWYLRKPDDDEIEDAKQFGEFAQWVEVKYKVKSSQGWAKIIEFWSQDEFDALDQFFTLLSEFKKEKGIKESQ